MLNYNNFKNTLDQLRGGYFHSCFFITDSNHHMHHYLFGQAAAPTFVKPFIKIKLAYNEILQVRANTAYYYIYPYRGLPF